MDDVEEKKHETLAQVVDTVNAETTLIQLYLDAFAICFKIIMSCIWPFQWYFKCTQFPGLPHPPCALNCLFVHQNEIIHYHVEYGIRDETGIWIYYDVFINK